jgi:hypothetical protein
MGLFDIFGSSNQQAASAKINAAANTGFEKSSKYLEKGANKATGYLTDAGNVYKGLSDQSQQGYNAYGNAAGVNGQAGYDQALQNFRTNPGYEFQQSQGLDALNRGANSRGMLSSGNNTQDILKYSQGLADQSWGDYMNRLAPYLNQPFQAAAGRTAVAGLQANNQNQLGQNLSDAAQNKYNTIGQSNAAVPMADQQASGQSWNAILSLLNNASKAAGAYMGA